MAWKYPKYDIRNGYVVDVDPINDNFLTVVNEVSGALNEHNFEADSTALTRDQLAEDAAMHMHISRKDVTTSLPVKSSWLSVAQQDGWQTFSGAGAKMDFDSTGAMTWLCASFQLMDTGGVITKRQKGFGVLVALRLDGAVIYDSLLGSGDSGTDFFNGFENRAGKLNLGAMGSDANRQDKQSTPYGGGGLAGARLPVCVDAMVELTPGPHTLEIAVRNIMGHSENVYVTARELFALELIR